MIKKEMFCRQCGEFMRAGMPHPKGMHRDPTYTGAMDTNMDKQSKQFVINIDQYADKEADARLSKIAAASGYAPLTKERY